MVRHAAVAFGRFNPIHVGHEALLKRLHEVALNHDADPIVYASRTQNSDNPLEYGYKLDLLKEAFGTAIAQDIPADRGNVIGVLKELCERGYQCVHMVVGKDRLLEIRRLAEKYNGRDYEFDDITYHTVPREYSASQMREHALKGNLNGFINHLPPSLRYKSWEIYDQVREGLKLNLVTPAQNIDVLLYAGLGKKSTLSIYRKVLLKPEVAVDNRQYWAMLVEMFKKLRDVIFKNQAIYDRVRLILAKGSKKMRIDESLSDRDVDYLLRLGLAGHKAKSLNTVCRRILLNPDSATGDAFQRKLLLAMFVRMRNFVAYDQYIFTRAQEAIRK